MAPATPGGGRRGGRRAEERAELGRLNDRLAAYIDCVRALQLQGSRLRLRVSQDERHEQTQQAQKQKQEGEGEEPGQGEAAALRLQLHQQRQREHAQHEHEQRLQGSLKKKEAECVAWRARVQELEGVLRRSEGELSTALAQKRDLEDEVAALRSRLDRSEEAHEVAKRQLEAETLLRVDLENRSLSLREELDFRKSLFEEEVRLRLERHASGEPGPAQKPPAQPPLALALEELRRQHQAQLELYRDEVEAAYRAKLESAKLSSEQSGKAAGAAQEELQEARLRIQALAGQLSALQAQANGAEERLREAEGRLAGERESFRAALECKEREVQEMREQRQQQLAEYQELLDVKLALDMEISAYRKLLEGEEDRLKLSPGAPPSRITVSRATSSASSSSWGKRKRSDEAQESARTGSAFQLDAGQGGVAIEEVDPRGTFVRLRNRSKEDRPLGNWRLKKEAERSGEAAEGDGEGDGEDAANTAYKFGPRFVLRAAQSVTVWSCDAGVSHRPPSALVWRGRRRPWRPALHARLVLLDAQGQEVATRSLSPEEEEADAEALGEEDLFHQQGDPRTTSKGCAVM